MTQITDLLQSILWKIDGTLINMISAMLNALINGVLGFGKGIFDNGSFVEDAFNTAKIIMFILLPCKLVYEVIFVIAKDEVENVQIPKKIIGAFLAVVLTFATPTLYKAMNNLATDSISIITKTVAKNKEVKSVSADKDDTDPFPTNQEQKDWDNIYSKQIDSLIVTSVLSTFGGMEPEHAKLATQAFKQDINAEYWKNKITPSSKICEGCNGEWKVDDNKKEELKKGFIPEQQFEISGDKKGYVWDHSLIAIFGFILFVVLLGYISLQVGMRIIQLIFFYIITPLCATSLTNQNNPQAFIVWKNSVLSNWITNFAEVFMLGIFSTLILDIGNISGVTGVIKLYTQLILFVASFVATIGIGSYVQAMLGGYGAGIMDGIQTIGAMAHLIGSGIRLGGSAVSTVGGVGSLVGYGMEKAGEKLSDGTDSKSMSLSSNSGTNKGFGTNQNNASKKAGFNNKSVNSPITSNSDLGINSSNLSNSNGDNNGINMEQNSSQSFKGKFGEGMAKTGRALRKYSNSTNASGNFLRGKGFNRSNLPFNADSINYNSPVSQADYGDRFKSRFEGSSPDLDE